MNAYYIAEGEQVTGPFVQSQLRAMWNAGQITAAAQACLEGTEEWEPLRFLMDEPATPATTASAADEAVASMASLLAVQGEYDRQKYSPGMAFVFGLIWPFGGQIYVGTSQEKLVGLLMSLVSILSFTVFIGPLLWFIALICAPGAAKAANKKIARQLGLR